MQRHILVAALLLTTIAWSAPDALQRVTPDRVEPASQDPQGTGKTAGLGGAPKDGWLARNQAEDGSFAGSDGRPDLEATSLVVLAFLGNGTTLQKSDPYAEELRKAIGWITAQQREDGRFEAARPDGTRRHAQATYALLEAGGLLDEHAQMRRAAGRALRAMFELRHTDGGWNEGWPGSDSDAVSTGWCLAATASAEFFQHAVPAPAAELVKWFDAHPSTEAKQVAAGLLSRFLAGQDPSQQPAMLLAADTLLEKADPNEPETCYWATYALFQTGGTHWREWNRRLRTPVIDSQLQGGDDRGSWHPVAGFGRATTTALRVLTLEAYYRYSRLVR